MQQSVNELVSGILFYFFDAVVAAWSISGMSNNNANWNGHHINIEPSDSLVCPYVTHIQSLSLSIQASSGKLLTTSHALHALFNLDLYAMN